MHTFVGPELGAAHDQETEHGPSTAITAISVSIIDNIAYHCQTLNYLPNTTLHKFEQLNYVINDNCIDLIWK